MGINIRTKGQTGEREVAKILNDIVAKVRRDLTLDPYATQDELFQRNQNQSAVGGADLSNPMELEIEIKRQEQLSINSWWNQCIASASRTGGIPILIFRQSRKKWRVIMFGELPLLPESHSKYMGLPQCRVEINLDCFKVWFEAYYRNWIYSAKD